MEICGILLEIKFNKYILLDNFHNLPDDVQKTISSDMIIFHGLKIKFIILGIWNEKNRLTQYYDDLHDIIIEIPVGQWEKKDLQLIVKKGEELLNVDFSNIIEDIIEASFDNVGIFQELCKVICLQSGINETVSYKINFDKNIIEKAINIKLEDYQRRHLRSLEKFCDSSKIKATEREFPLFIAHCFVYILLKLQVKDIINGIKRAKLHDDIKKIHYIAEDVRARDMSYFLHNITLYQINRNIIPPLFAYDRSITILKIIDPTLYFYLRYADKSQILEDMKHRRELLLIKDFGCHYN